MIFSLQSQITRPYFTEEKCYYFEMHPFVEDRQFDRIAIVIITT